MKKNELIGRTAVFFAALSGAAALAGENLLPETFVNDLCQRRGTGVTYLKAEGELPEGVLITTDRAHDPIYKNETSAAVPFAVKKGDLIVLTAAVRGVSPNGKVSVLAKLQDNTYVGALREFLTATSPEWTWCRVTGVATKDYAAGSMRLHVYPWTGAQQAEIRGWRLENFGQMKKSELPPLPPAPKWPTGELKAPEPPPPPKPVVLAPLSPEEYAKKRYVMLKFDDVGNHNGSVNYRFARLADYLASKKLKSGFGVIVKSIDNLPNEKYIEWLKKNAVENGGLIEFWNHGWDHAMFFNCTEDDDCDRTTKFHGEHATGLKHQERHLNLALDTFKKWTGLTMHTLGTAGNAGNADTLKALRERPEMKVWLFGQGKADDILILGRWLNLEHAVGKVDYETFKRAYQNQRQKDYVVLQGHPAMWPDQMFEDFKKIVELLENDGWLFVTPYEYYRIQKGELEPPVQKPQAKSPTPAPKTVLSPGEDWIPLKAAPVIEKGSALDFSAFRETGAPCGKFGRVVRRGPHFEFEGRPGRPIRFYGVNLCFSANYPEYDEAKALAANLARIGYNAVRIHHHDGLLVGNNPDSTELDPAQLKRLDGLVAACSEEGLYLTTDLFVSRPVSWKAMGIDKEGTPAKDVYKVLVPIHPGARRNFLDFSRRFLTHVNEYTGRRFIDEPAFCLLAFINEGNAMNWGGKLLQGLDIYKDEWRKWLAKKASEDPEHYGKVPDTIPENAWAWGEHTPAFTQFLCDVESNFCREMKAFLRDEIKAEVPVTNLSSWWNPVVFQRCRADTLDVVDDHFYIDHPQFLGKPWRLPSKCVNVNPIKGEAMGMTDVCFKRLLDRPFTITEYNYSGPGRFRGVGGIATGAAGALQDWDGLWRFAWAHGIESIRQPGSQTMGYFNMADDPLSLAAERASICLFLRRDLEPLKDEYAVVLPPAALATPDPKQTISRAPWKWACWHTRLGTIVSNAAPASAKWTAAFPAAYSENSGTVRKRLSGNGLPPTGGGHASIDPATGAFALTTPRTCGGFAESGTISAGPFSARLDSAATVWASSLDGKDISESSHILVTHLTDLQNAGITYRDSALTILEKWGSLPYIMRRGGAKISLDLAPGDWAVRSLDASGKPKGNVPSEYSDGRLAFMASTAFDPTDATYLYELTR